MASVFRLETDNPKDFFFLAISLAFVSKEAYCYLAGQKKEIEK